MKTMLAAAAVIAMGLPALAQGLAPAEAPPEGFEGDTFVDSNGCVFLRAGVGDRTVFVPRLTADRQPVCGQAPTVAQADVAPAPRPEEVAPAAGAISAGAPRPRPEIGEITDVEPATFAGIRPAARGAVEEEPYAGPVRRPVAVTPRAMPKTMRPIFVKSEAPHVIHGPTVGGEVHRVPRAHPGGVVADSAGYIQLGRVREAIPDVHVPYGYRRAWEDGRLNPYRGPRAFTGAVETARVWRPGVPRELRERPIGVVVTPAERAPKWAKGRHIYVGGVREIAQARHIARKLRALGLPVQFRRGPRELIIVTSGPYGAEHAAARALAQVRAKGYSRAYLH